MSKINEIEGIISSLKNKYGDNDEGKKKFNEHLDILQNISNIFLTIGITGTKGIEKHNNYTKNIEEIIILLKQKNKAKDFYNDIMYKICKLANDSLLYIKYMLDNIKENELKKSLFEENLFTREYEEISKVWNNNTNTDYKNNFKNYKNFFLNDENYTDKTNSEKKEQNQSSNLYRELFKQIIYVYEGECKQLDNIAIEQAKKLSNYIINGTNIENNAISPECIIKYLKNEKTFKNYGSFITRRFNARKRRFCALYDAIENEAKLQNKLKNFKKIDFEKVLDKNGEDFIRELFNYHNDTNVIIYNRNNINNINNNPADRNLITMQERIANMLNSVGCFC